MRFVPWGYVYTCLHPLAIWSGSPKDPVTSTPPSFLLNKIAPKTHTKNWRVRWSWAEVQGEQITQLFFPKDSRCLNGKHHRGVFNGAFVRWLPRVPKKITTQKTRSGLQLLPSNFQRFLLQINCWKMTTIHPEVCFVIFGRWSDVTTRVVAKVMKHTSWGWDWWWNDESFIQRGNIYCRKEIEENPQEPEQNIEGRGLNS